MLAEELPALRDDFSRLLRRDDLVVPEIATDAGVHPELMEKARFVRLERSQAQARGFEDGHDAEVY